MSVIKLRLMGVQRCDLRGSSKLMTKTGALPRMRLNDGASDCRRSLRGQEICSRRCTSQNLFYLLLDVVVHDGIRLTRTRRAEYH